MKITKPASQLLISQFVRNGVVSSSAVDTDHGTYPLWGQLCLLGYVEQRPASPMGHKFSFGLTTAGEAYLNEALA